MSGFEYEKQCKHMISASLCQWCNPRKSMVLCTRCDSPVIDASREAVTRLTAELEALRADAAIGQLVRRKMVSGNSVPVERCHITAAEVAALEARKGAA